MEEKRKPTRWGLWIAVALLALVGYPLSLGPYYYMVSSGRMPVWFYTNVPIYRPVQWLCDLSPRTAKARLQYMRWWAGRP